MQLRQKISDLIVSHVLRLGKNATLKVTNADGTESTVSLTELSVLDGLTATVAELNILDGVTATAAELNQAADISARASVVAAATNVEATDNGKTFYLNSATGFACTLPVPAVGLKYKFVVSTAPTTGNHTIKTDSDANLIHGQICTPEDALGSVVTAAAADIINFVANLAIIGDYVELESDGTSWFVSGMCSVQDGITTVQTA